MKRYSFIGYNQESMARAIGVALPISFKQSVEVCRFIKNKKVSEVKKLLERVIQKKVAVPFKRYNFDLAHKKKIGPGRYPEKTSKEILKLIESVEANAQFKGLGASNLIIEHISAHKSSKSRHFGRKTRRVMKRTHIEIIVKESNITEPKKND